MHSLQLFQKTLQRWQKLSKESSLLEDETCCSHISFSELLRLKEWSHFLSLDDNMTVRLRHSKQILASLRNPGLDYGSLRPYQPGDEFRHIHWLATARSSRPLLKQYGKEQHKRIFFVLHLGQSMFKQRHACSKAVIAAEFFALLGWLFLKSGFSIGACIITDKEIKNFPPTFHEERFVHLLKAFSEYCSNQQTIIEDSSSQLLTASNHLLTLTKPGDMVFFLGDFQELPPLALKNFSQLKAKTELQWILLLRDSEFSLKNKLEEHSPFLSIEKYRALRQALKRVHINCIRLNLEQRLTDILKNNRFTLAKE